MCFYKSFFHRNYLSLDQPKPGLRETLWLKGLGEDQRGKGLRAKTFLGDPSYPLNEKVATNEKWRNDAEYLNMYFRKYKFSKKTSMLKVIKNLWYIKDYIKNCRQKSYNQSRRMKAWRWNQKWSTNVTLKSC